MIELIINKANKLAKGLRFMKMRKKNELHIPYFHLKINYYNLNELT